MGFSRQEYWSGVPQVLKFSGSLLALKVKEICLCVCIYIYIYTSFPGSYDSKVPTIRETRVQSLGQKDPLEKELATHSSIHAWKIPWTKSLVGYSQWVANNRTRLRDFTSLARRKFSRRQ